VATALEDGGLYFINPSPGGGNTNTALLTAGSGNHTRSSPKAKYKPSFPHVSLNNSTCPLIDLNVLHARLGHFSLSKMQHIPCCKPFLNNSFTCETCTLAKFHRLPFNKSIISTKFPFQLVHMDLWGPYKVANISDAHYFPALVDDFSRTTRTQLLQDKTQVVTAVIHFFQMVSTQFHKNITMIRTNNGT